MWFPLRCFGGNTHKKRLSTQIEICFWATFQVNRSPFPRCLKISFCRWKCKYENSPFHCIVVEFRVPGISGQGLAKRNNETLHKGPRTSISKAVNKISSQLSEAKLGKKVEQWGAFGWGSKMNSSTFQRQCRHRKNQVMSNSRWIRQPRGNATLVTYS